MAYDDPRWMGGLGMIGTKAVYNAVVHCDLLLMVGTDYPYSNFLPTKGTVIQIDERAQVLGRRAPTVLGVIGSARPLTAITRYWHSSSCAWRSFRISMIPIGEVIRPAT